VAPVLGVFAERDTFVPPAVVHDLEAALRAAGKRTSFTIHPGVDHAFLNDTRPDVYDAEVAARAWAEAVAFLRAELAECRSAPAWRLRAQLAELWRAMSSAKAVGERRPVKNRLRS
jgi:hypothetical protein